MDFQRDVHLTPAGHFRAASDAGLDVLGVRCADGQWLRRFDEFQREINGAGNGVSTKVLHNPPSARCAET
jgi:hypothetical protein